MVKCRTNTIQISILIQDLCFEPFFMAENQLLFMFCSLRKRNQVVGGGI